MDGGRDGAAARGAGVARPTVNYAEEQAKAQQFLRNYASPYQDDSDEPKYMRMLQDIANRARRTLPIELDDIADFFESEDADFASKVEANARRYAGLFYQAADKELPLPKDMLPVEDTVDVLVQQRQQVQAEAEGAEGDVMDEAQQLPPALTRRYEVQFVPRAKTQGAALRQVRGAQIGSLVTVKAIVTRVSDVKPLVSVATYTCDHCGNEVYQEVTGKTFLPVAQCPTQQCKDDGVRGQLTLQARGSTMTKFQEAKIQELTEHVPMGHIPRSMTVHLYGELTRSLLPGDVVSITGAFLPVPFSGYRAMRAGLLADTFLEATHVQQHKKNYEEMAQGAAAAEAAQQRAEELAAGDANVYDRLASSIAPEIYGHEDVKKALLLLMVSAPTRSLRDGMKLRGDIHVCLMGDPGVAKSQLLKHISRLAPRVVYTTGRGSSGVGLTAAVHRDPVTNEFVLEGGALVLADRGICCIDEFDKMEEGDRTAIHEVMEQQTVSIAKAGITTTLNARAAVLAAANPAYGRYDMRRTPSENIALPAALLSRFDLLWLILDRADPDLDQMLAQHILHVHRHLKAPELDFEPLSGSEIREYIAAARAHVPAVPAELTEYVAATYAAMRQEEAEAGAGTATYTTARTLLSILRLSAALARLRFAGEVGQSDVDEALRLMKMSKHSLAQDDGGRHDRADPISAIYQAIRDHAVERGAEFVPYGTCKEMAIRRGFSEEDLRAALDEYAALNVFQLNAAYDVTLVS